MHGPAAHEHDRPRLRSRRLQAAHDLADGLERQRAEQRRRQRRAEALEDLDRIGASVDLGDEVARRGFDQTIDQRAHEGRVLVGGEASGGLVGRGLAGDHVARHRPGRPAETEQGGLRRQLRAQTPHGLDHRREMVERVRLAEPFHVVERRDGLEPGPLALLEPDLLAERVRDHQDVGEQDRRVEPETAYRLQRHLDGVVRRIAHVEEPACTGARLLVLGQVPPRLAHQPDRLRPHGLAVENPHHSARRSVGHSLSSRPRL